MDITILEKGMLIIEIVLAVVCLTGMVILMISKIRKKSISCISTIVLVSFACLAIMLVGSAAIDYAKKKGEEAKAKIIETMMDYTEKRYEEIEEVKIKVHSSGYVAYLDGIEVDIDNVKLEDYSITIDDEQKKIFMTK